MSILSRRCISLSALLWLLGGGVAHAQSGVPVDSTYPVRSVDRPATLTRGAFRFDAFGFRERAPDAATVVTFVAGGGFGVSDKLELGGQVLPLELDGGIAYTNPSVYATYALSAGSVAIAPTLQVTFPLASDDPLTLDIGAIAYIPIGPLGYLTVAPDLSLNARDQEAGSSFSLPLTWLHQLSDRVLFQLSSGAGLARFEPRFGRSRLIDSFDFDELTIPLSTSISYTLVQGAPLRPRADFSLQFQWPQWYTRAPDMRGFQTNDWSVQVGVSWYFLRQ